MDTQFIDVECLPGRFYLSFSAVHSCDAVGHIFGSIKRSTGHYAINSKGGHGECFLEKNCCVFKRLMELDSVFCTADCLSILCRSDSNNFTLHSF